MSYGFPKIIRNNYENNKELVCFIDGGAVTMKTTLVSYSENNINVIFNSSTDIISGHLVTNHLLQSCLKDLRQVHNINLENNKKYLIKLYQLCDTCKIKLSVNTHAELELDMYINDSEFFIQVSIYQRISRYLSERTYNFR